MINSLGELRKGETGVDKEKQLILSPGEGSVRRWRKRHCLVIDLETALVEKEKPELVVRLLLQCHWNLGLGRNILSSGDNL
jgi:hypothetical protein